MKRRGFISLVSAIPFVGKLFAQPTPFWVQTSPANLIAASRDIVACAESRYGSGDFTWKVGCEAGAKIMMCGAPVRLGPAESRRMALELGGANLKFCGLRGYFQRRPFPHNRLELFSDKHGRVGTIDITD